MRGAMILAILQARMSSRRLPGKVMRPLLGKAMLGRQIDRLRRATRIDRLVVATSTQADDDAIAAFCVAEGVACFQGPLDDVLTRFHGAAAAHGPAEAIVRLTADCPLADWRVIDRCVGLHLETGADYTSNAVIRSFPVGLDVEVMTSAALDSAFREARDADEREHVTLFVNRRPTRFRLAHLVQERPLGALRWCVDTPADFAFVEAVYARLFPARPDFGQPEILDLLERMPDLAAINAVTA